MHGRRAGTRIGVGGMGDMGGMGLSLGEFQQIGDGLIFLLQDLCGTGVSGKNTVMDLVERACRASWVEATLMPASTSWRD